MMEQKYLTFFLKLCSLFGTFQLRFAGGAWAHSSVLAGFSILSLVPYFVSQTIIWNDLHSTLSHMVYGTVEPILISCFFVNLTISQRSVAKIMDTLTNLIFISEHTRNFYPQTVWPYMLYLFASIAIVFGRAVLDGHFFIDVTFSFVLLQILSTTLQFTWIIRMCTLELSRLNDKLLSCSPLAYEQSTSFVEKNEVLVNLMETFVNCYGKTILVATVTSLIEISALSSDSLLHLVYYEDNFILKCSVPLAWAVGFILAMWDLMDSCENTYEEAERFNKLLASCALKDRSGRLLMNPYITMHFATKKNLQFTACKCFNIDYRLGCSMVAACVTYLVILVQIDGSKNASSPSTIGTTLSPATAYNRNY